MAPNRLSPAIAAEPIRYLRRAHGAARLDFIFEHGWAAHARVEQVAVEYTEDLPGESFEPSDHYGVSAIFQVSDR